ncbi:DoxX family protein [Acetobacteraceae bacterium ESL0709]|nr:DoxX family protein [Acetobacteraceae bacterium ESL0697]MDF7677837.1 DoxX family protein [Acetobacteraceae bacterium ESL0709]
MASSRIRDTILVVSRSLLTVLFILMGWEKFTNFPGTTFFMSNIGLPFPSFCAAAALIFEAGAGSFVFLGVFTSSTSFLLAAYTIATAFLGHHYWKVPEASQHDMFIHFYKNISIAGGFLALAIAGPGRFSLDTLMERNRENRSVSIIPETNT